MQVLVVHTLPPHVAGPGREPLEFNLSEAAEGVAQALPEATVAGIVGGAEELLALLDTHRPDVVFNLCEAPFGRPALEAHVAALLEWRSVRFTGCGSETLALCRRKDRAKAVLAAAGVPVPNSECFPCIVKPADEDGSAGIDLRSVCADRFQLEAARSRLAGPAIVEEFLTGREFVVSLWGDSDPEHLSIGEMLLQNGLTHVTYAAKWVIDSADFANSGVYYDTTIEPDVRERISTTARAAWRAVEARGYLRLDVRLDAEGTPRVLDVNPNPEMTPEDGMHRAVTMAGWSWDRFVQQQIRWARF